MYEYFPEMRFISIEADADTIKRQKFHKPCKKVVLTHTDMKSFINQYEPRDKKSIFWLDYTGLELSHFEEFKSLLEKIATGSMIKITVSADVRDYAKGNEQEKQKFADEFRAKFRKLLPNPVAPIPWKKDEFAYLVQHMLKIAAEQSLPAASSPVVFQPVSSFYYSDGTCMLTLTGIVWNRDDVKSIFTAYRHWEFVNTTWSMPCLIEIPVLTNKERLKLQPLLPCAHQKGQTLLTKLGYLVDNNNSNSSIALEQYALFHRYSPYFMQGFP